MVNGRLAMGDLRDGFAGSGRSCGLTRLGAAAVFASLIVAPTDSIAANANIGFSATISDDRASGLSPLYGETVSFVDDAGIRFVVSNPGKRRSDIRLTVYDSRFQRIEAQAFPARVSLGSGASSEVTVIVPFAGKVIRNLNICAERVVSGGTERQVCGRHKIRRVSLD